jgi:hypothetical protein
MDCTNTAGGTNKIHVLENAGGRFSMKAAMPSFRSFSENAACSARAANLDMPNISVDFR